MPQAQEEAGSSLQTTWQSRGCQWAHRVLPTLLRATRWPQFCCSPSLGTLPGGSCEPCRPPTACAGCVHAPLTLPRMPLGSARCLVPSRPGLSGHLLAGPRLRVPGADSSVCCRRTTRLEAYRGNTINVCGSVRQLGAGQLGSLLRGPHGLQRGVGWGLPSSQGSAGKGASSGAPAGAVGQSQAPAGCWLGPPFPATRPSPPGRSPRGASLPQSVGSEKG